jgi:hypothetical protein
MAFQDRRIGIPNTNRWRREGPVTFWARSQGFFGSLKKAVTSRRARASISILEHNFAYILGSSNLTCVTRITAGYSMLLESWSSCALVFPVYP